MIFGCEQIKLKIVSVSVGCPIVESDDRLIVLAEMMRDAYENEV